MKHGNLQISQTQFNPETTEVELSLAVDEGWAPPRANKKWNQDERTFTEVRFHLPCKPGMQATKNQHNLQSKCIFPSQTFVLLPPSSRGCEFLVSAQAVPGRGERTQMSRAAVRSRRLQPEGDGRRRGWVQRKLPGRAVTRGQQC